jgi:hypothetical protein
VEAPALSEEELRAERAKYFDQAGRIASELHNRWQREPCRWNPTLPLQDLNALVWFKFVHADNPWESADELQGRSASSSAAGCSDALGHRA